MKSDKPFILIDGSSYLYRAFHALPPLTNTQGQPTGAIYGVINMIRKLIKDYEPEYVAVVFDAKGKTFRDEIFAHYKAKRPPMPDDLQLQIAPLQALIQAMGLPMLIIEGVEADDVIGTLACQGKALGLKVLISTGDKDMAQLVDEDITLINTMTNVLLNPHGVQEKFGVPPQLIVDYLAMVGDTSDNIPGIPQVGPKTALKWIQQYGDLEQIKAHAEEITGKVGENLRNALADLPLFKTLATIKLDVPLPLAPLDLKPQPPATEKLITLFQTLEFKNWLKEIVDKTPEAPLVLSNYQTLTQEQEVLAFLHNLQQSALVAYHLEQQNNQITGVGFALGKERAVYIPIKDEHTLHLLKPALENPKLLKIGYDCKHSLNCLANYAIHLQGLIFDVMLESYVLNPTGTKHDLETLSLKHCGHPLSLDEKEHRQNAGQSVNIVWQLHQKLWPELAAHRGLKYIFEHIEMPLLTVLSQMELQGVLIDAPLLHQQSVDLHNRLQVIEEQVIALAGQPFNLNSPKQLQEILFEKLKLPIKEKTPTGQPSTSESVLQELALDFPLPKLILEYRSLSKLKSTYTDALPKQINPVTQRVHTCYNQAITATGRLSSTEPNLQNIPIRTQEGRKIRQAFIAPPQHKILAADYSQIELRIMAHLSEDSGLINAFNHNQDIHAATAAEVFNIPFAKVSADDRRRAKAINFGLIYGMSAFGLGQALGISSTEANNYIQSYFQRYPLVKQYMEETRKKAHHQGYVETLFGRRLYLPEINSANISRQRAAERAAINAPMQGTAADIIKLAMIAMAEKIAASNLPIKMIMQVHDELVFEAPDVLVPEVETLIEQVMSHTTTLSVPLVVDIAVGKSWGVE